MFHWPNLFKSLSLWNLFCTRLQLNRLERKTYLPCLLLQLLSTRKSHHCRKSLILGILRQTSRITLIIQDSYNICIKADKLSNVPITIKSPYHIRGFLSKSISVVHNYGCSNNWTVFIHHTRIRSTISYRLRNWNYQFTTSVSQKILFEEASQYNSIL